MFPSNVTRFRIFLPITLKTPRSCLGQDLWRVGVSGAPLCIQTIAAVGKMVSQCQRLYFKDIKNIGWSHEVGICIHWRFSLFPVNLFITTGKKIRKHMLRADPKSFLDEEYLRRMRPCVRPLTKWQFWDNISYFTDGIAWQDGDKGRDKSEELLNLAPANQFLLQHLGGNMRLSLWKDIKYVNKPLTSFISSLLACGEM